MTAAVHSSKASEPMRGAALAGAAIVERWDTITLSCARRLGPCCRLSRIVRPAFLGGNRGGAGTHRACP